MSQNDMIIGASGALHRGTLFRNAHEESSQLQQHRDVLDAAITDLYYKGLPMLEGNGFIVMDPKNPRFSGREHKDLDTAQEEANEIAYASGKAIIYAPALILKPDRPTLAATPTALLEQALGKRAIAAAVGDDVSLKGSEG